MKTLKQFITESQQIYNPIDSKILNFFKKHPSFSKMASMKLCSESDSDDYGSHMNPGSFEEDAAFEIFAKVCDVDCSVKDPEWEHHFKKIDVDDKLITTYRDNYCGAITGKADGKDFVAIFYLYAKSEDDRKDFTPFPDFDFEVANINDIDEEAMWMAQVVLYM